MLNESNLLVNTFKFKQSLQIAHPKLYDPKTITVVPNMETMVNMVAENEGVMTGNSAILNE